MKNAVNDGYLIEGGKVSFVLDKVMQGEAAKIIVQIPQETTPIQKEVIASAVTIESSLSLQIFDYMDPDDLFDLEEYASKLSSIMLLVVVEELPKKKYRRFIHILIN